MLETENVVYDELSKGKIEPSKWKIMSFPIGEGENWVWQEPKAKIEARNGGTALTVDPFTRKHDHVHMFDDPKQLYGSTRTFPVSRDSVTLLEVEMGAETFHGNAQDIQDGFAGFITMDFLTGMIFDFVSTGRKIGAIYERLLIPGVTDEETSFTYLVEAPFARISTRPEQMHRYTIRIDGSNKRVEWFVDEKPFFRAEKIPVVPQELMLGFGLFTLKPIDPEKGSVSVHGQGAAGIWKNFKHTLP